MDYRSEYECWLQHANADIKVDLEKYDDAQIEDSFYKNLAFLSCFLRTPFSCIRTFLESGGKVASQNSQMERKKENGIYPSPCAYRVFPSGWLE